MILFRQNKNKIFIKLFLLSCLFIFSFSFSSSAFAALVPCGVGAGNANCTLCHLVLGFKNIYDYLLSLLLAATTLVIVVAGVMYMVSSGAKGMIEKAKSALTYALTAMILALLAWLIINTVLNALGYNKSGSWWTFTCDTVQTVGPTTMGSGGATLPGNTPTPGKNPTNIAQGDGSCGGTKDIVEDSKNCGKTSQALDTLLTCIKGRMNATSSNSGVNKYFPFGIEKVFAAGNLFIGIGIDQSSHTNNSCHYGGLSCQGQANAADLHGDLPAARDAAIACGADTVMYDRMAYFGGNSQSFAGNGGGDSAHVRHVHVSVNNKACGCDYLKNS